jgi:uncharacterized protein YjcR
MINALEFRIKRDNCKEAYLNGKTDPTELAVIFGVSDITVRKWIKSGKWDEMFKESVSSTMNQLSPQEGTHPGTA